MTSKYNERVLNIETILLIKNLWIDQNSLRECCLYGIPDKFRPLVWRLFLDYLPAERQQWAQILEKQRAYYASLVENFVLHPVDEREGQKEQTGLISDDHPLALDHNSRWTGYFKDNELLKQIENDARRLRPEIDFFQRETQYPMQIPISLSKRVNNEFLMANEGDQLNKLSDKSFISSAPSTVGACGHSRSESNASSISRIENDEDEKHWEVVERILYVYAKANRGVGYVQGMNELLGPIYYVFASDSDNEWARHAEADSFYCFQNLMSEIQDIFIRKLDGEHCGIEAALVRFYDQRFEKNDPILHSHMVNGQQIKAEFFAFRWISLLLSQEFCLPDLISLWDHLFASKSGTRIKTVECLCLAMLEQLRDQLLEGDFPSNLRLLQNFPEHFDVLNLIIRSMEISNGQTFREHKKLEQKEKSKISGSNNHALPNVLSSVKSRFTTPLKNLVADTSAKLAEKMSGSEGPKINKGIGSMKEKQYEKGQQWKNVTL